MTYEELVKVDVSLVEQMSKLYQTMADGSTKEIYNKWPPEEKEVSVRYKTFGREFVYEQKVKVLNPEGDEINARDYETKNRVKENVANFSIFLLSRCRVLFSDLLQKGSKAVVFKDEHFRVRVRNWWSASSCRSVFDCWVEIKKKGWGWREIASWQCCMGKDTKARRPSLGENWRPIETTAVSLADDDIGHMQELVDRIELSMVVPQTMDREEFYKLMDL